MGLILANQRAVSSKHIPFDSVPTNEGFSERERGAGEGEGGGGERGDFLGRFLLADSVASTFEGQ